MHLPLACFWGVVCPGPLAGPEMRDRPYLWAQEASRGAAATRGLTPYLDQPSCRPTGAVTALGLNPVPHPHSRGPVGPQPSPTGRLRSELVSVCSTHGQQSVAEVQVEPLLSCHPTDHLPARRGGRAGVSHCPRQASESTAADVPMSQARRAG